MDQVAVPSEHDVVEVGHDAPATGIGVSNTKLAMWLFLSSDCLFFGAFISAYLFYSGRSQPGPHPLDVYNIPFTSVTSFILALGLPILGYAAVFQLIWLVPLGAVPLLFGMYAWAIEPQTE